MVFEIWNEIGNLIDDQKNLINSLNDISIKGNVGISYVLEWFIKWRIENRLGMNGNYDRYTVLNWMKSGIESLYIIILTQFIPLFSLFFSYFSILFFFFFPNPVGGPVPYFRAHTRLFRVAKGNYWDRSARVQDDPTCVARLNSFSRIREREKKGTWSNEVTIHFGNIVSSVSRNNEIPRNSNSLWIGHLIIFMSIDSFF